MTRPVPPELLEFLEPFPDDVAGIGLALRTRVLGSMPCAHEIVWDATNAVSLVYAPSARWQGEDLRAGIELLWRHAGFEAR